LTGVAVPRLTPALAPRHSLLVSSVCREHVQNASL
jgi:hypothetical protein